MPQLCIEDFNEERDSTIDDVETPDELREWAREYAQDVVDEHGEYVDLSFVEWAVDTSDRRSRRAADMKHVKIRGGSSIGGMGIIDWEQANERLESELALVDQDDAREVKITLTWEAFQKFDGEECRKTVRHELLHVEQFHKSGTADHGLVFESEAEDWDTTIHCPKWKEPKYLIYCTECGDQIDGRYRRSKVVKEAEKYNSKCCGATLRSEENPEA